jgi:probable HAF family extracellular repeat protein
MGFQERQTSFRRRGSVLLAALTSFIPMAHAQSFTTIDYPGSTSTIPSGINNNGTIVGAYIDAASNGHGFVDNGGVYTSLDVPGQYGTECNGINNNGTIVGAYYAAGTYHGFMDNSGTFSSFDFPGAIATWAKGINDSGVIVGYYQDSANNNHGFLYNGGVFSSFDFPGAKYTEANGINNNGTIVGNYIGAAAPWHGFVDNGGVFNSFDFPGATSTYANGINNSGTIVGLYQDAAFNEHGFVDNGGVFGSIDFPGTDGHTVVKGINDNGASVGDWQDAAINDHGFLYVPPAPIPAYINPKYMIVGVTYAPPGSQSFVQYTNSSAVGNTTAINSSFTDETSVSISVGGSGGIEGYFQGSATNSYASTYGQTLSSSNTVTITQTTMVSDKTLGPTNSFAGLDHDLDVIWLWLNPVLPFSFPTNNPQAITWNGYGYDAADPAGPLDIYPVSVGVLNGDFPVPSNVAAVLARTWASGLIWAPGTGPGLTGPGPGTDFANIVQADPFWQCAPVPANCPTTVDLTRFTLSDNQPAIYKQADPGGQPQTYGYQYQYSNTSTQGKQTSTTQSQAFGLDDMFSFGNTFAKITQDFKSTQTLTWTTSVNTSITQTGTTVAQASITGPTCTVSNSTCSPLYTGPSELGIYQDNQFGTFMFFPIGGTSGMPLSLPTSTTVPSAMSGLPYGPELLTATGGSGTSYNWCVQFGAQCVQSGPPMPPGFLLSSKSSCGNACTEVALVSTGNPPAPVGSYPFTVQVTDSAGNIATEPVTVTITQGPTNVTGQLAITSSGLAYSRVSQTFNGTVTIKNIGTTAISGPLQVLFVGVPASVSLVNATGNVSTTPYMTIPAATGLAPGQSVTVSVKFKNPLNTTIHLTPAIYSGSI